MNSRDGNEDRNSDMNGTDRCAELRDALTEVALGVADGTTRGEVMAHLATCDRCRDELSSLSAAADELLLLVPEREPAAGFEGRVLDRLAPVPAGSAGSVGSAGSSGSAGSAGSASSSGSAGDRRPATVRRHRMRRTALAGVAAAGLLVAGGASVWVVTAQDRELAASYRTTLDTAGGHYLAAADLVAETPTGDSPASDSQASDSTAGDGTTEDRTTGSVGTVFLYDGNPSWAYVVVRDAGPADSYDVTAVVAAGTNGGAGGTDTSTAAPYGRGVHATEPGHTTFDRRNSDAGTPPGAGIPGSAETREVALGSCVVTTGTCSAGGVLDVPVSDVRSVRLAAPDGTTWATAALP
ncbi:zf-HC2 domain-containing protein [Promicromonospora sp. NPDC057488]|uniref:zf-HC2 domain-containing protein n=1 Tax=Promicromonospora sp. NPDC057488 TaxID=3346147 RepID=UPI003673263D